MRHLGIFLFIVLTASSALAQVTPINVKVLEDDPYKADNLYLKIAPLYFGRNYETEIDAGFGVGTEFRMGKFMDVEGSFRIPYGRAMDGSSKASENTIISNHYVHAVAGEATLTFHIFDRTKEKKVEMLLGHGRNPEYLHTMYAHQRNILGLRAGFSYYQSVVSGNYIDLVLLDTLYGTTFSSMHNPPFTNLHVPSFVLGISRSTLLNLKVETAEYGENRKFEKHTMYLDALCSPQISVDDFLINQESFDVVDVNDAHEMRTIGGRAGFEMYFQYLRQIGFSAAFEVAIRPGLQNISDESINKEIFLLAKFNVLFHQSI